MQEIGEPIPSSVIATSMDECYDFVKKKAYPVIIRPAYTLGGTGGGIAENKKELELLCVKGMENSAIGQILLEKSVAGWKEIEYEVIRDSRDNCIIICSMENLDPVGVHTGDSIVVAPTQTLRDAEYQMLRDASIKIIRNLQIEGGCNVQFALDPDTGKYIVIEVNPRVSRSSALASKAAGYPIAKIAAKIAIGYNLDELSNYVTQTTSACFEPTLDYVVVKFPEMAFRQVQNCIEKARHTDEGHGRGNVHRQNIRKRTAQSAHFDRDQMRRSAHTVRIRSEDDDLVEKLKACDDERIFCIAEVMRRRADEVEVFTV